MIPQIKYSDSEVNFLRNIKKEITDWFILTWWFYFVPQREKGGTSTRGVAMKRMWNEEGGSSTLVMETSLIGILTSRGKKLNTQSELCNIQFRNSYEIFLIDVFTLKFIFTFLFSMFFVFQLGVYNILSSFFYPFWLYFFTLLSCSSTK